MSSSLKPIHIWGKFGPNPPKVAMICEELSIPYEVQHMNFEDLASPKFFSVTPNGRMPAIKDPNNGDLVIWESGAIIEYLVERYDKEHRISFPQGSKESYLSKQWLFFQVSGQGPYFGQAVHFAKYHSEPVASTEERYTKEVKRVTGVLEKHLASQEKDSDGPWLVGNKFSYADMSVLPWHNFVLTYFPQFIDMSEYPVAADWLERIKERAGIAKVLEETKMPRLANNEEVAKFNKDKQEIEKATS